MNQSYIAGKSYSIRLAESSGFCFGVKNATDKLEAAVKDRREGERIYTLGQLIHNDVYIQRLRENGVFSIDGDTNTIVNLHPLCRSSFAHTV